ncbi:MAG: hypothetical protein HKP58_20275 [Desulfatitalea sp.]|nr:hypothetical protein [Desulfatitalea sp.]NNK02755.1 hypothetical protein [Desulfatitalea sp.]
MIHGKVLKHITVAILLTYASMLLACGQSLANENQPVKAGEKLLGKLIPLAEHITSDIPTLEKAIQIMGGSQSAGGYDQNQYACYDGDGYFITYYRQAQRDVVTISRAEIVIPKLNSGIRFQDIVSLFGKWQTIAIGKTSTVSFAYKNKKTGHTGIVFARLYDPPKNSRSYVLGITIDHDHPWDEDFKQ